MLSTGRVRTIKSEYLMKLWVAFTLLMQLYNFVDKGDRKVALRPELTPSLARLVLQKGSDFRNPNLFLLSLLRSECSLRYIVLSGILNHVNLEDIPDIEFPSCMAGNRRYSL